ncbi:MAG: zinc ribbon domain-containing protein [Methanotrichaceae archaeon]
MVETRTFYAIGIDQKDLARMVSSWLKIHDFESQLVDLPDGRIAVQARQPESWRSILGMSSALNITFGTKGSDLMVEAEAGRWADKIAVGAVGAFIIHPLLITAAYGTWKQSQLPDRVFEVIEQYLKEHQGPTRTTRIQVQSSGDLSPNRVVSDTSSTATPEGTACPNCGQAVKIGAKYCDQCGAKLKHASVKID